MTEKEKTLIDQWLIDNNLDRYGGPMGSNYLGGTPLFDERTGQRTDRYEYILKHHPGRPWLKK